ncbi:C40 family peptidase [Arthrobacter sp. 35W]|uniref:C40 family peptidase n=1 Tax=Arthrobacter sp. 35W TaxID=1132441 RepID=UPI000688E4A7|nr:C40 family peptidase [Arthrobacter sp. 35W]
MAAPAFLLAALKRRALARLVAGAASAMVLLMVMALCGGLVVLAAGAQITTTACLTAASTSPATAANTGPTAGLSIPVASGPPINFTAAQVAVARAYIGVGISRGVPIEGIQIAIMMSLQESGLRMLANLAVPGSMDYLHDGVGSDHDSIGSAQQRPSAGWGSVAELMNPIYNAEAFYGGPEGPNHGSPPGLLDVRGWQAMTQGEAAQAVQRSAFPELYARWEAEAKAIVDALKTGAALTDCPKDLPIAGMSPLPDDLAQIRRDIIRYAEEGLGGAYVWGGTAFKAWDCSGYVQWVYRQAGIQLPRTEQWLAGRPTAAPKPGDLVVQNPDRPNHWGHVGIYAGNGMMFSALNPGVGTLVHPVSWNPGTEYIRIVS